MPLMLLPAAEYALLHQAGKLLWRKARGSLLSVRGGGVVVEQSGPEGAIVASAERTIVHRGRRTTKLSNYGEEKETWGVLSVSGQSVRKSNEIIWSYGGER